ncbi:MAG: class I SAM-dependent methyltransferase [Congregibacter sp.]
MTAKADTFERSCEHWSDAGRNEMEAFYELAQVDYRHLAEAYDWADAFQTLASVNAGVRLADIACGSGKFPQALLQYAGIAHLGHAADVQIDYDLLDPSDFSLREARQALMAPFEPDAEFCCTLQDWDAEPGHYQVAWATHALYCVPEEELEPALARMCSALSREGFGFVAQGMRDGHYVNFYDLFLTSLRAGEGTSYSDGAQVAAALQNLGMHVQSRVIEYTTTVPANRPGLLESYLQRCAFDDSVGLEEMLSREPLAAYLASCRDPGSGDYRFPQKVGMSLFSHTQAPLVLHDAKKAGVA